jgi:hypothetical protein
MTPMARSVPLLVLILATSAGLAAQTAVPRPKLPLVVLPDTLAICRLGPGDSIPAWANAPQPFVTLSRTPTELSITALEHLVASVAGCQHGYRPVRVQGPLPLDLVGVVAAMAQPLADAGVSLFAISTFETDYILVQDSDLPRALAAWLRAGHTVRMLSP